MSSSDDTTTAMQENSPLRNDPYAWVDGFADDLHEAAKQLVEKGEAGHISDEALAKIMTASVRLYYAKAEGEGRIPPTVIDDGEKTLTATEMLTTVSEMLRAVKLGPMELGLWFRRRPGD
ncbi:MAG: hypothetical protein NWT00_07035 [Beijerinckiaceae bacterium]|jgi:hypothetical protein|nr:hypothetical protein [Beijerinckiaceae bacterium]